MKLHHDKYVYDDNRDFLHLEHVFHKDYILLLDIAFLSDSFLDLQKDIFQEYFSLLVDRLEQKTKEKEIRHTVEHTLQELNAKLVLFADKLDKVDYFSLKGSLRIFADDVLVGSLIGDTSMMIFRENSLYYAVSNEYDSVERIDLFSEFLEGEIESGDEMIILWYDIHTVFDKHELKKFNNLFSLQGNDVVDFLEEIMTMRIDISLLTFLLRTVCTGSHAPTSSPSSPSGGMSKVAGKMGALWSFLPSWLTSRFQWLAQWFSLKGKNYTYPLVIGVMALIVLWLGFGLLKQIGGPTSPLMTTDSWDEIEVTVDGIKKDLAHFQRLDPTSDEKWHLYRQLIEKLDFLESSGRWVEDVQELKKIVEKSYQKWFNIVYEDSLDNFDDEVSGAKANILAFNTNEAETLGAPLRLFVSDGEVNVIGSQGSLLDIINSDRRGSLVGYDFSGDDESVEICNVNLLRNGAYCVGDAWSLYNVTKAGVELLTIDNDSLFPSSVADLGVFGNTNFYVLTRDLFDNQRDIYIIRYRNVIGSQIQFTNPTDYPVAVVSGASLDPLSMDIDTTFLTWHKDGVHQRWREGTSLTLSDRIIPMLGGDNQQDYSDKVRIMTHENTRYILLFDAEKQSVTVYDTVWLKTNDAFSSSYSMSYVMRFLLNLSSPLLDVALDESSANAPIVYALTAEGVYKIKVIDFVDEILSTGSINR
jgi:hypothetical protein